MFELAERLGSAKQKVLESVGVVSSSLKEHPNASLSTPVSTLVCRKTAISPTIYSLWAELKQAQALKYLRMSDRPR